MTKKTRAPKPGFDRTLFWIILTLLAIGLVTIASAGVFYGETRFDDEYHFLKRQAIALVPGLLALYLGQLIDYRRWRALVIPLFVLTLVLLVLVFIPGVGAKIYGASRWISIGPLSFQPSELAKLSVILYLAAWLSKQGRSRIRDLYEGLLPFLVILGALAFLILKQPDTGTLGVIFLVSLSVFFAGGAKLSHLLAIVASGFALLGVLIQVAPYRMQRFLVFLNPEHDPQGAGYHIQQALLAIGTGGIFGLGLGHSRQKFNYLPEPVTDSIFAVFAEEWGLIGALVVIGLFIGVAARGYRIARRAPDEFGKLVAVGITTWIVLQAFVNIAAITGLIPLTGIPLPFLSYGGTSLTFLLAGVGILLNISKQTSMKAGQGG